MNESRTQQSSVLRIVVPIIVALVLVVGTVLIAGSSLNRIEDITLNRIVAGTYGTPDWRVLEMNPLLSQLLTLLYRIIPAFNWYGGLLLALLGAAVAAGISLAARKRGGLIPAIILLSPIAVLLANTVISTTVCALCAVVGALSIMDGLQRKKAGVARLVVGIVLFVFAVLLSIEWAVLLGAAAVICWLPHALLDRQYRGLAIGLALMAVIAAALFGYTALMYSSPELSAYRSDSALYNRIQHSSLEDEANMLLETYGGQITTEGHSLDDGHGHTEEELAALQGQSQNTIIPPNSFDAVDWNLNDATLLFWRYGTDSQIVNPDTLRTLEMEASFWNFSFSRLTSKLFETVKKPQFLMLIALFVLSALAVLVTTRRRGWIVLIAAIIAFGGHILAIAHYYDTFADIAPFYLLGIGVMLFFFDGEAAKSWYHKLLPSGGLRMAISLVVLVGFVGAMGGVLYYTRKTPANASELVVQAVEFLKPYISEHKDMLFIGDNPNDRFKPPTLQAPVRGEDENLLAGSYDLYSPRAAALMEKYGITNPLPDSFGRDDIGYVLMGFPDVFAFRLNYAYDIYMKEAKDLLSYPERSEMIVQMVALTPEEIEEAVAQAKYEEEQAALWAEALADLEAQGLLDGLTTDDGHTHDEDDPDHVHEDGEEHDHEDEHDHSADVTTSPVPSATPDA